MNDTTYYAAVAAYEEGYESAKEELTAMTEQRDGLRSGIEYATEQLVTITAQRNRLAEALQKLADCDWVITLPDRMDAVRTIANEALQSLTPTQPEPK
jgi:hypothetical protein